MLSQENQIALIKQYNEYNDSDILQQIIAINSKVIKRVVKSFIFKNSNLSSEDLYSAGIEGIIIAVGKFSAEKSDAFLPYAKLWIKVKIQEYVKNACASATISGRNGRKLFSNYYRYRYELENEGIPTTLENLSKHSNISENEIADFVNALASTASLFKTYDDSNNEEERFSTGSVNIEKEYEVTQARNLFNDEVLIFNEKLTTEEKIIWQNRCYNVEPEKISVISSKLGIPPQKISSIEKTMLKKFKKQILNSPLKDLYHSILE